MFAASEQRPAASTYYRTPPLRQAAYHDVTIAWDLFVP